MDFWYRVRFPLLATGMIALLGALWGGLLRLGWSLPALNPSLYSNHGPLMAAVFLAVVIGLERAVALGHKWSYSVPALTGIGGLFIIFGSTEMTGQILVTLGALALVIVNIVIIRAQFALFTVIMGAGSVALMTGDALWLMGEPIYEIVIWWIGFLVLTISAERLELSRFLAPSKTAQAGFIASAIIFIMGIILMSVRPDSGPWLMGLGMLAITLWLSRYDIARRTIKQKGLTRFVAICLLSGYIWLGIGGALAFMSDEWIPGFYYDATLHAVFLGFVFSMIFGHAPIIFPAVLRVKMPFDKIFYSHLILLHVSLVTRFVSDIFYNTAGQMWGGLLNELALLLFIVNSVRAVLSGRRKTGAKSVVG